MRSIIGLGFGVLLSSSALAGMSKEQAAQPSFGWVGQLSLGATWANGGDTQTFYLTPDIEKTFFAQKKRDALAAGELFVGAQKPLSPTLMGQLGLSLARTGGAKLQGMIHDDADPLFANHSYCYKVHSTRIAAKGRLIFNRDSVIDPFVSAQLGVSFNKAHGFINTPFIEEAITNPNFGSNTTSAFTYVLAAGVQKSFSGNWNAGVRYEFADWGKSALARDSSQTMNRGLSLSHLYTNGVMVHIGYTA
jgi:opacity protein-like surface antigen